MPTGWSSSSTSTPTSWTSRPRPGASAAIATLAAGRPAFVWRRQVADTETPVAAALKLIEPGRGDFLLESVEGGATRGRHSLIGLAPDLVFRAHGDTAEINRHWATDRTAFQSTGMPTLAALRALAEKMNGRNGVSQS